MKKLLLLFLLACKHDPADIAKKAFPERWNALCYNTLGDEIALCTYKTKVYVCFTSRGDSELAFCFEALDPETIGSNCQTCKLEFDNYHMITPEEFKKKIKVE